MTNDDKLEPCRFCGGRAREPIDYGGKTGCADLNCAGSGVIVNPTVWNRRPAAPAPVAEILEALREARTTLLMLKRNVETEIRSHDGLFRWEGVPEAIQTRINQCDATLTAGAEPRATDAGEGVVVPLVPTDAMIEAFYHAEGPAGPDRVVSWSVATAMARGNVFRHLDDIFANAYRAMLAAAPSAPVVGREEIARLAHDFVTEQSEGEWGEDLIKRDADKLTDRILSALQASPDALSECLSALRAIKANGGDPEDVNRATCAIERAELFALSAKKSIDPRLTEWGYSTEAITHLGQLLEDQAAFDGLAKGAGHD